MSKKNKLIDKIETKLDTVEKLIDEISLIIMDCRQRIDKFNEDEHIEDFPELDHFENLDDEDIDEEEDKE
jgi:uncharacterized coiled-coil protein SlyX